MDKYCVRNERYENLMIIIIERNGFKSGMETIYIAIIIITMIIDENMNNNNNNGNNGEKEKKT